MCVWASFQSRDVTMVLSMPATRQLGATSTTAAVFANSALGERCKAGPCHVLLPSSSSGGLRSSSQFVADRQYNAGLQPLERRPGSTHVLNCTSYSTSSSSQARVSSWQDESPVVLNVSCTYPLFPPFGRARLVRILALGEDVATAYCERLLARGVATATDCLVVHNWLSLTLRMPFHRNCSHSLHYIMFLSACSFEMFNVMLILRAFGCDILEFKF